MKCAIMQPTFLPWIGYFSMLNESDLFVYLDNVQLARRSWQVRNRIKTVHGEFFLNIPIKKTAERDNLTIADAIIDDSQNWRKKHLESIRYAYKKAFFFEELYPFFEKIYAQETDRLSIFTISTIEAIKAEIGVPTVSLLASSLKGINGQKDDRLLSICEAVGADEYLSAQSSKEYIEMNVSGGAFTNSGIKLTYQNYQHPVYQQLHGDFSPYMCIADLLFNVGFKRALDIINAKHTTL